MQLTNIEYIFKYTIIKYLIIKINLNIFISIEEFYKLKSFS